ncbi:MAG TPA: hypothetical protein VKB78_10865, partial [Pirellulales bacterium]|nr:hypothetical protein [Pirellulales bacterium]
TEVSSKLVNKERDELLGDPDVDKKAKKVGAEFFVVNSKGAKIPLAENGKVDRVKEINEYLASGGDDALKKRGKSPSKMTFQEKYYESIGGEERRLELEKMGYAMYDGPKIDIKIEDLKEYREYVALGGDDVYCGLGGPQNKEVTFYNRNTLIKQKLAMKG